MIHAAIVERYWLAVLMVVPEQVVFQGEVIFMADQQQIDHENDIHPMQVSVVTEL